MTGFRRWSWFAVAVGLAAAGATVAAQGAKQAQQISITSADTAKYQQVLPGVSKAVLYGNPDQGAYGAFTRFAPGEKNPLHIHSSDIRMVVLEGAYVYEVDGRQTRAGPGSYVFIPAGTPHVSGGDPGKGALFFEESPGKFDLIPVKGPTGKK